MSNVWQKPLQYCKVINFQLIKINWGGGRRTQACLLPPHIILGAYRGQFPFSDVQEASPAPLCPHPSPADLNTPAAVIGCGACEARNPRALWAAHVENAGSDSHGVQGQRPQIRPGLTQSGTEADEQELAVGA